MADPDSLLPTNDNEALDFGKKKKKKKPKEELLKESEEAVTVTAEKENQPQAEAAEGAAEPAEGEELILGKKKKAKSRVKFDDDQNEVVEIVDVCLIMLFKCHQNYQFTNN